MRNSGWGSSTIRKIAWMGIFLAGFYSFSCKTPQDLEQRNWDAGTDADSDTCECEVEDGPCCDGCNRYQESDNQVCETVYDYNCADDACGADTQKRTGEKTCQGGTSACTGDTSWGDWETEEVCSANQFCETDKTTSAECITCEHGCGDGACWPDCDPAETCCESDGSWTPDWVQQPGTELYWKRCPLGKDWDVVTCTCTGGSSSIRWCDAMGLSDPDCLVHPIEAAYVEICEIEYGAGYRLPTEVEFVALLSGAPCEDSTTCAIMFGSDYGDYWSSLSADSNNARQAYFNGGYVGSVNKDFLRRVRCLRTGP